MSSHPGYFVRMYTQRGGFVSDGVAFATLDEALDHIDDRLKRDRETPPTYYIGGTVWHHRAEIAKVYAEVTA